MIYLLVDTSTSNITISILNDNKVVCEYVNKIDSDMSSKILPIIDKLLKDNKLGLDKIDKIFVVNGPGSFTGVRIGITICKTIAWSLKKDIITLSSLELMATTNTEKKYLVPMIDARRGNVFAGIYDNELNCIKNDQLININELVNNLEDNYEFISYDNININNLIVPRPNVLKIIKKHKNDVAINPHNVNPNYLKLTEAQENLNKKESN